ncbi:hypothetical protein [Nitrosopumilus sp.]|uniref:hypothetical protein n=1 Tax=Nitrosopumilus sp. TaxID=2024843 RepID=UPI00292DA152|nr:hypothetical protein [Nitrosopumilus sp.]
MFRDPSKIVKKLGLSQDSFLYVEMIDNLIVMKKHDPKLTKTELNKITLYDTNTKENPAAIEEKLCEEDKEFDNSQEFEDLITNTLTFSASSEVICLS